MRAYASDLAGLLKHKQGYEPIILPGSEEIIRDYLNKLRPVSKSPNTLKRKFATFRSFYNFHTGDQLLPKYRLPSSIARKKYRLARKKYRFPLVGDGHPIDRLIWLSLSSSDPLQYQTLVIFLGYGGMRLSEALNVKFSDLFIANGHSWITVVGKGNKVRDIPLLGNFFDVIYRYWAHDFSEPVSTSESIFHDPQKILTFSERTARNGINHLSEKAELGRLTPHDLRRIAGTNFYYTSGKDIRATQDFLGHSSVTTTERYINIADEKLRAGIAREENT